MIPLLLCGPAGSGKTHRCLAEAADRLRKDAFGKPLLFIAPRQATYQLERQILSLPGVEGFTRVRILSFQRLAHFVFEVTGVTAPPLLDEQGRIMVFRSILSKRRSDFRVYRQCAHREGLAQELSDLWREAMQHRVGPAELREAARRSAPTRLSAKLLDFADVFEDYREWLKNHQLRDGDELLDIAADAAALLPAIEAVWLDGFAQMTPQERRLLIAVMRPSESATLAFCLPSRPLDEGSGFSMWDTVARTYCRLRSDLEQVFGDIVEETLQRRATGGRFDASAELAHLERYWGAPRPFDDSLTDAVRVVKCRDLESEAILAAREILSYVRGGGRYRDTAVLVRSLDGVDDTLRRVFRRYKIPFFLDRRHAVAHHPLAELTRGALKSIAFGWRHRDLFAALKSGLATIEDHWIDWFENLSLARGWSGDDWREPLACGLKAQPWETERAEEIRRHAIDPFFKLERSLGREPSGIDLANALREFWAAHDAEARLDTWAEEIEGAAHSTIWTQMEQWLATIEQAFGGERMTIVRWLEVIEAALDSLTVGLIPPSLDQTLIGAIDRSRNPDLKRVFLVGVNEGSFPQPSGERLLLDDSERESLREAGVDFGVTSLWDIGAEQFYGYIACTRARESVCVTYSETSLEGEALNPSIFIAHLQRLLPSLEIQEFKDVEPLHAVAAHEFDSVIFAAARRESLTLFEQDLASWDNLGESWRRARSGMLPGARTLNPATVEALYGTRLRTSVSKLEQFAMCPFRFFIASGLRAEERLKFELDRREQGSFQHEVLAEFHKRVEASGKRWRDVTPAEARDIIATVGNELRGRFQEGLTEATAANRFRAEAKLKALQDFVASYVQALGYCDFDPKHVEIGFGNDGPLPAWNVAIDDMHSLEFTGRIDRVDLLQDEKSQTLYALALDYKSGERKLDRKLVEHAIQQQLLAYLAALQKVGLGEGAKNIRAAGAFYINLRPKVKGKSRAQALDEDIERDPIQVGLFDWAFVQRLDPKQSHRLCAYNKSAPKAAVNFGAVDSPEFAELIAQTEERLREKGRAVFAGDVRPFPYRWKQETPCLTCKYGSICRFDAWTNEFNSLDDDA